MMMLVFLHETKRCTVTTMHRCPSWHQIADLNVCGTGRISIRYNGRAATFAERYLFILVNSVSHDDFAISFSEAIRTRDTVVPY